MGILNLTPDSFSDGGDYFDKQAALAHAEHLVDEGAQIIDVGGESTRPGSEPISIEEEKERVLDVVAALSQKGYCVSIDTRHAEVARACLDVGAALINDISGFRDQEMVALATETEVGLVVMHMKGTPDTMQDGADYEDVVKEVYDYLEEQTKMLECAGIAHDRICIDPGPGFGKTSSQTLELVRNFHEFVHLGYPVMAALSRKSYIGKAYHIDDPKERDDASAAEALMACELGASVIRTHNIAATQAALKDLRPLVMLGLGANVALVANPGEEREGLIAQLNHAISDICLLPDSQLIDVSSFYESEPAYHEDQDPFINAVVSLRTGLPPLELLTYIHSIEDSLGRVRELENGPRTCDIDILDYQMYVCQSEELTLPHPRLLERDFVVAPLTEIAPGYILADGRVVDDTNVNVGRATRC